MTSPKPWTVRPMPRGGVAINDRGDEYVGSFTALNDARQAVIAANYHDRLVEALERLWQESDKIPPDDRALTGAEDQARALLDEIKAQTPP